MFIFASMLLAGSCSFIGSAEGFNPASFHRAATEKRIDETAKNDIEASYPVQMPQCLSSGGVCTSASNCPRDHLLTLRTSGPAPCGDQTDVVCCKPTLVNQEEVLQVDACDSQGAVCTRTSACPREARMNNPLLCGDQADVTCCRVDLEGKRSLEFRSNSETEILRIEAVGVNQVDEKNGKKVSEANHNQQEQIMNNDDAFNVWKKHANAAYNLRSLGVAKRREPTCVEVRGLCIEKINCPQGDIIANENSCSGDKSIVCCKLSKFSVAVDTYQYANFPDGGTDPEETDSVDV